MHSLEINKVSEGSESFVHNILKVETQFLEQFFHLCYKCDFRSINPFAHNAAFLYLLIRSENRKVFWYFQGVEKGCIGNKWVSKIKNGVLYFKISNSLQRGRLLFITKPQQWAIFIIPNLYPANIYLFKVNNGNIRAISEICSKYKKDNRMTPLTSF